MPTSPAFDEIRLPLADARSCGALVAGEAGATPVLLLHGFPDIHRSWRHQLPVLAAAGYRATAPLLRGYEASTLVPPRIGASDGTGHRGPSQPHPFHPWNVADDVIELAAALDPDGRGVHLVGHDWGSVVAYLVAARAPERFASLTTIAVPAIQRPERAWRLLPAQARKSWYMLFFQLRGIAERSVSRDDFAFIVARWRDWSPGWEPEDGELAAVIEHLGVPGVLGAALGYYRSFLNPMLAESRRAAAAMGGSIARAHLALTGATDGCIDTRLYDTVMDPDRFPAGLRVERIPAAGHFAHQERPDVVNDLLLDFFAAHPARA